MNARFYNSLKNQYGKIKKEVYGRYYTDIEDAISAIEMSIDRQNDKVESIYQAIAWTVETGRMPGGKLEWLDEAKGSEIKKMFALATNAIGNDLSMAKSKEALYGAIPA